MMFSCYRVSPAKPVIGPLGDFFARAFFMAIG
jgi:hypothetical protein